MKIKESEKKDMYLVLAKELKKAMEHKGEGERSPKAFKGDW